MIYDTNKLEAGRLPQELLTLRLDECQESWGDAPCFAGRSAVSVSDADDSQAEWNTGTLTDVTATAGGELELASANALDFDGTNDVITISSPSSALDLTSGWTLEAWVNADTTPHGAGIIAETYTGAGDDVMFEIGLGINGADGGDLRAGIYHDSSASWYVAAEGTDLPTGSWQHVAATWDGSTVKLYRNGALVTSTSASITVPSGVDAVRIGQRHDSLSTGYFDGTIFDVRIWSSARTQTEIQDNMFATLTGSETGLVGWWPLDEGTGTTATDNTSNSNDGTISGATWTTRYEFSGNRESANIDLSSISVASGGGEVTWTETLNGETHTVETNLSTDGGSTWAGWQSVSNGGAITGITSGTDLSNALLKFRNNLSTEDPAATPSVDNITVTVNGYGAKGSLSGACRNTINTCQFEQAYNPDTTKVLRFSRQDQMPLTGENVWPALVPPVRLMPAKIDPGRKGLGRREEVRFTLRDFVHDDVGMDPYVEHRTHDTTQGTFMGKLLASNPYVHNRPCEYGRGFLSTPPDLDNDFKTRHYVIDRIEGPDRNNEYQVVAKDPLALLYSPKAQLPELSPGELASGISATDLSLTLSPAGISDDYPATGEVNVRGETIEYTSKVVDGSGVVTLSWPDTSYRGKWGTGAIAHSAGDRVQVCESFVDVRIDEAVRRVVTAGNLTDAQLDLIGWDEICDLWFSDVLLTNHLTKPYGVDELLGQLQQLISGHWVWDPISQKVVMRHEMPEALNASVPVLTDTLHLVGRDIEVSEERDRWISQVWVYYAPISYSEGDDDENFQYVAIAAATDEEGVARQDDKNILKIYARWFDASNGSQANGLAQRVANRFKVPPKRVAFTLEAKDDGIGIGDHIAILSDAIQGLTGAAEQTELQVTSLKELAQIGRFRMETLSYAFGARYCFFSGEAAPDYESATMIQKQQNGYFCDDTTELMSDGEDPYLFP